MNLQFLLYKLKSCQTTILIKKNNQYVFIIFDILIM